MNKETWDYVCGWPTYLGDGLILFLITTTFIIIWDEQKILWKICAIAMTLTSTHIIIQWLKRIVYRERPYDFYLPLVEKGQYTINALFELLSKESSFPSGHSAIIFALVTILCCIYGRRLLFLYSIALFIGFTRIYIGVHFPSDVVAGAVIGISVGRLLFEIVHKLKPRPT